jgi:DtxR family Mn-dependent transcriptional regulator
MPGATSAYVEEYLEALYTLTENGKIAKTTDISKHLKLKPGTVTEMLQRLSRDGYIHYEPYHGVTLTKKGLKLARKMVRKHRLLERFLTDILKVDTKRVHQQACDMEHALSDDAEDALCRLLKHPERCPDDDKFIPICNKLLNNCAECMERKPTIKSRSRTRDLVALTSLQEGRKGVVAFIRGGKRAVRRLIDMGLTPRTEIELTKSAPFGGPIEISVRGSKLAIGRGIAGKIFVEAS